MVDDFKNFSEEKLTAHAEDRAAQGPVVEAMRRLREKLDRNHDATEKLTKRLLWYTIAIFVVTLFQLGVAIVMVWMR